MLSNSARKQLQTHIEKELESVIDFRKRLDDAYLPVLDQPFIFLTFVKEKEKDMSICPTASSDPEKKLPRLTQHNNELHTINNSLINVIDILTDIEGKLLGPHPKLEETKDSEKEETTPPLLTAIEANTTRVHSKINTIRDIAERLANTI